MHPRGWSDVWYTCLVTGHHMTLTMIYKYLTHLLLPRMLTNDPNLQCMQTMEGHVAQRLVAQEFEDIMRPLVAQAKLDMWRLGFPARFSYDNNRSQGAALLHRMGMQPQDRVPLAPHMPDGHKVIEHVVHQVKSQFWASLYEMGDVNTDAEAQARLVQVFFNISTTSILQDVQSLPVTYQIIATDEGVAFLGIDGRQHVGTGSDWPPSAYR